MTFANAVDNLASFVNTSLVPLLFSLAFIAFLIGMVRFFFIEGEEGRQQGRQFALWGIVGLTVMFSLWGIVNIFLAALK